MSFDIKRARRADTAAFTFQRLSLDPSKPIVLQVRSLGQTNRAWVDAEFKRLKAKQPESGDGFERMAADRDRLLADIARFAIVSWNVTRDGRPVECTPDEALSFLRFAADNGYDDELAELRAFVGVSENFREPLESGESLGKG